MHDPARPFVCSYCGPCVAGAGPRELHRKTQHHAEWEREKTVFSGASLSLGLQQSLVDLLRDSRDAPAASGIVAQFNALDEAEGKRRRRRCWK